MKAVTNAMGSSSLPILSVHSYLISLALKTSGTTNFECS
jgi:hypothetical protein